MARVTHVKAAQQRYETKPVLDDQGNPVKIALTRKDGSPKMTRAKGSRPARPITITKTVADKSKPKPLLRCDFAGCTHPDRLIQVGQGYKWIKPKSGPYGGRMKARHAEHPSWQRWEYNDSLGAQLERISYEASEQVGQVDSMEDAQAILEFAAQEIRGLAEQKRESASNIEDGFGHATYQSEELNQVADDLDGWADEVESTEVPDPEDSEYQEDTTCDTCQGDGKDECGECMGTGETGDDDETCPECDGTGTTDCPDCDGTGENPEPETDWDAWRDALTDAMAVLDEIPV